MTIPAATTTGQAAAGKERHGGLSGRLGLTVPRGWWPSPHLLKSFEAAGFGHVQIHAPPVAVLCDPRLLTRHALALSAAVGSTGLRPVLHGPDSMRLGGALDDLAMDGLISYAAEIGADQLIYHALALPDEPACEEALRHEAHALSRAARRAHELGLRIAVENLCPLYPGVETLSANPMSLRGLATRLAGDGVGICLDLGHAHVVAELRHTSIERLISPVLDLVTLFHAHDNFGARRAQSGDHALGVDPLRLDLHLPPGRGTLPWHTVGPLIRSHAAPVVLEVHPPFRPRIAALHDGAVRLLGAPREALRRASSGSPGAHRPLSGSDRSPPRSPQARPST